jgi:hypothetical protein
MSAMREEGPALDILTRRLAECPSELRGEPRIGTHGTVHVAALVFDTVRDLGGALDSTEVLRLYGGARVVERNELRLVMLATWLLHDPWFLAAARFAAPAQRFLAEDMHDVAGLVSADLFVTDPDRREELVRLCLAALGLRPAAESSAQAEDRLKTLNSVERARLIRATQEAQQRARKLREEMQRKQAAEAAAKATREW